MVNKHYLFIAYATISVLALSFSSCSSDESEDTTPPIVENATVLNMMKGSFENATKIGTLYINESNNLTIGKDYNGYTRGEIATVGKINGLGGISGFPKLGYCKQAAALKGYGYVFYNEYLDESEWKKILSRLFIEEEITDKAGNFLGYRVVYENPYYGKDQEIKFPKDEIFFTCDGGRDTITFTDGEPMIIDCKSSAKWCYVNGVERKEAPADWGFPCVKGIEIEAISSDTIGISTATINVKTKYGKEKNIRITRAAAKPRLSLYNDDSDKNITLPVTVGTREVQLDTNIPIEDIQIMNTASEWCDAKLEEKIKYDYYHDRKYRALTLETKSNDTGKKRSGTITLKYKNGSESLTINVEQDAPYIKCDYSMDNPYTVSYYSDYNYIYFTTNLTNISESYFVITNSTEWMSSYIYDIHNYSGYTGCRLRFSVNSNYTDSDREGVITISDKSGKLQYQIKVVQRH